MGLSLHPSFPGHAVGSKAGTKTYVGVQFDSIHCKCAMPLDIWQTSSSVNMQKLYQGGSGTGLVNQFISRHAKGVSRWRNRSDRPGKCWTTVCYTAPEEASRCYLSNPKFQKISCHCQNTSTIFCQTKAQMLLPPLCIQLHWRDSNIHSLSLCTNFK